MFCEGEELAECHRRQKEYFKSQIRKRLGQTDGPSAPAPRKRRRVKTFVTVMQVDNMISSATGLQLADFVVQQAEDGTFLGDPWQWKGLSLASDSGPDCVVCAICSLG